MQKLQMNRTHPIKIAILNLMPNKITTEHQLLRLLGKSPRSNRGYSALYEDIRPNAHDR